MKKRVTKKNEIIVTLEKGRDIRMCNAQGRALFYINSNFVKDTINLRVEKDEQYQGLYLVSIYMYNKDMGFNNYVGMICRVKTIEIDNPTYTSVTDMWEKIDITL